MVFYKNTTPFSRASPVHLCNHSCAEAPARHGARGSLRPASDMEHLALVLLDVVLDRRPRSACTRRGDNSQDGLGPRDPPFFFVYAMMAMETIYFRTASPHSPRFLPPLVSSKLDRLALAVGFARSVGTQPPFIYFRLCNGGYVDYLFTQDGLRKNGSHVPTNGLSSCPFALHGVEYCVLISRQPVDNFSKRTRAAEFDSQLHTLVINKTSLRRMCVAYIRRQ